MPLSEEEQRRVQELAADGMGRRSIAAKLDLSERMVRDYLEALPAPTLYPIKVRVWDLETTDFKADIGEIRVASFFDLNTGVMYTRTHRDFDSEVEFVEWIISMMNESDVLVGHNSLAFDKPYVTGVAARLGLGKPEKRIHWDTYLIARYGWKANIGYSLENIADHLGLSRTKSKPSKHKWRELITDRADDLSEIVERCESDCLITAEVFDYLKPYLFEWKGNT